MDKKLWQRLLWLVRAVTAQFLEDENVATPETITNALRMACDELLPGNNPRRASDETVAQRHSEHVPEGVLTERGEEGPKAGH